ncbi:MAG: LamG domain-containing protein, partial [Acidobacteriia bacterium]|nr:LamG domain-containing protein [Terriglobia bacterium]
MTTDSSNQFSMHNDSETVGFWINTQTGFGDFQAPIGFASDHLPWAVYSVNGNRLYMKIWNDADTGYDFETYYVTITSNQWIYATFTMSKSGGNMTVSTYMNGKLVGSETQGVSGTFANGGVLSIWDPSLGKPGKMDEVKIYPYARTADQIKQDYNAGLAGATASHGTGASSGNSPKWMTDGLVGHWEMDESSGTAVNDATGNANDGTLTNAEETGTAQSTSTTTTITDPSNASLSSANDTYNNMVIHITGGGGCGVDTDTERTILDYTGASKTFTVDAFSAEADNCTFEVLHQVGGKFGTALSFDGQNDYVNAGHGSSLNNFGNGGITVSAWVNLRGEPSASLPALVEKSSGDFSDTPSNQKGFYLSYGYVKNNPVNGIRWGVGDGTGYDSIMNWNDNADMLNRWRYLTCVADPAGTPGAKLKLYMDGVLVDSADRTHTGSIDLSSTDLNIARWALANSYFNGLIDDMRIYNRALSPDEINQLADWVPAPIHDYNFDEKSGTTAHDTGSGAPEGNVDGSLLAGLYGNADSGTTASLLKETDWYFGNDNSGYYDGWNLKATSGAANGNVATITNYNVIDPSNNKEVSF